MAGPRIRISVQAAPFDAEQEARFLTQGRDDVGALVSFTGLCRGDEGLRALELEHYPAMAEKQITSIVEEACRKWPLLGASVVHRFGYLPVGAPIVLVMAASRHRHPAFQASGFIMDYLKSQAPFWKKQHFESGAPGCWVKAREKDKTALARWEKRK